MKAYDVAIKSAFSLHKIKLTLLSYFHQYIVFVW